MVGASRAPALVFGGWNIDLDEAEVLDRAKKAVADLALDIDLAEAFMPGKNRGFLIIPMTARPGEDRARLQRRAISSVEVVRKAALPAGGTTSAGKPTQLWLAIKNLRSRGDGRARCPKANGQCWKALTRPRELWQSAPTTEVEAFGSATVGLRDWVRRRVALMLPPPPTAGWMWRRWLTLLAKPGHRWNQDGKTW